MTPVWQSHRRVRNDPDGFCGRVAPGPASGHNKVTLKGEGMNQPFQALDDFLLKNVAMPVARQHLYMEHIRVYVRLTTRRMGEAIGRTLDLADIEVDDDYRGQGIFRRFLDHAEKLACRQGMSVYVESILNPWVIEALQRRDYEFNGGTFSSAWMSAERLKQKYESADETSISP